MTKDTIKAQAHIKAETETETTIETSLRQVLNLTVEREEGVMRLDRWFRNHFPHMSQIKLQKLLRSGQVRVDGKRAKAADRVFPGQVIRIPPLPLPDNQSEKKYKAPQPHKKSQTHERLVKDLHSRILYKDEDVLIINKPFGLAVQGGTGTALHLDAVMDDLQFEAKQRPRLVHRLDKDTAGVLVLARSQDAARKLAACFKHHDARKYYWAVTKGRPNPPEGQIDASLAKSGESFEKVEHNEDDGRKAITEFSVVQSAGKLASWVALWPVTGRTHQLRAHMSLIGTPILGDPKYGEKDDFGTAKRLHLFARRLILPHPNPKKGVLDIVAPPPEHIVATFRHFGFEGLDDGDPFKEIDCQGGFCSSRGSRKVRGK